MSLICWFWLILLLWGVLRELRLGSVVNQLASNRLLSYLSVHVLLVSVCRCRLLLNRKPVFLHDRSICVKIWALHEAASHWFYLRSSIADEAICRRILGSSSHTHCGYIVCMFVCRHVYLLLRGLFFGSCAWKDHWLPCLNCCLLLGAIVAKTGCTYSKFILIPRSFSLMIQNSTRIIQIITS